MMRYWPVASVTTVRVFSMSAGLDASTVTPGSTPPEASRTVPVSEPCANTEAGNSKTNRTRRHFERIRGPPSLSRWIGVHTGWLCMQASEGYLDDLRYASDVSVHRPRQRRVPGLH